MSFSYTVLFDLVRSPRNEISSFWSGSASMAFRMAATRGLLKPIGMGARVARESIPYFSILGSSGVGWRERRSFVLLRIRVWMWDGIASIPCVNALRISYILQTALVTPVSVPCACDSLVLVRLHRYFPPRESAESARVFTNSWICHRHPSHLSHSQAYEGSFASFCEFRDGARSVPNPSR